MAVQFDPYPTRPLSDFRDELRFEFPDLPTELFDYYLLRTARDMAQTAGIFQRTLRLDLVMGVTRYLIESPDGMAVDTLQSVRFVPDGNIEHGSRPIRRFVAPPQRHFVLTDACWYVPSEKTLVVHVPLCAPGAWCRVVMTVVPERDACELPAVLMENFLPVLVTGARAQIMMITGRPWSNLKAGAELQASYRDLLAKEATKVRLNGQAGYIRMRHGRAL